MISHCKIFLGYHMQLLQILPSSNSGGPPQPRVAKKKKKVVSRYYWEARANVVRKYGLYAEREE